MSKIKNAQTFELIADKLRPLFQRAYETETVYIMILVAYEIIEVYDTTPLKPLIESIMGVYLEDIKLRIQLEKQAWQEVRQVHTQLREYATRNAITARLVLEELDCFETTEALPLESGLVSLPGQFLKMKFALLSLPKNTPNYPEFIKQFAILDKSQEIDHFTFAPSLELWDKECLRLAKIEPTRIWHNWDTIANAYLLQDPKKASETIDINQLKHHLQRLESYTIDWIKQYNATHMTKFGKPSKPTYDSKSCVLKVNGVPIEFEKGSIRAKFLRCFFKKGAAIAQILSLEDLHAKMYKKKIGYFKLEKNHKDALYNALDDINLRVSNEASIPGFLTLKKSKVAIRSKYLN